MPKLDYKAKTEAKETLDFIQAALDRGEAGAAQRAICTLLNSLQGLSAAIHAADRNAGVQ